MFYIIFENALCSCISRLNSNYTYQGSERFVDCYNAIHIISTCWNANYLFAVHKWVSFPSILKILTPTLMAFIRVTNAH